MFLKKRAFNQLGGVQLCMRAAYKIKNISMHRCHWPNWLSCCFLSSEPIKEYTQPNDQVSERGNPTMNETKGEDQTESDIDRETNKPPDVYIPLEKDYTEAEVAKLKAFASTNETPQSRKRKGIN